MLYTLKHGRESSLLTWENIFFLSGISDPRSSRGEAPSPKSLCFTNRVKYYKANAVLKVRNCNHGLEWPFGSDTW